MTTRSNRRMRARRWAVLGCAVALCGCATTRMAIRHGTLETRTEMRDGVFLELRGSPPPTVYVSESSSVGSAVAVRGALERELRASGYTIVDEPDYASYVIQLNHLSLVAAELEGGQTLGDAIEHAFIAGAGTALAANIVGLNDAAGPLGLGVGVVSFILDARTKHMAHTLTTDVMVTQAGTLGEGDGVATRHSTRVVSGASKMNLGRGEALPAIVAGLSQSLAGLLPVRERSSG